MATEGHFRFPPEVTRQLAAYVYRLIDPRNGETFYIGKGRGNRVFAHVHDELGREADDVDDKLQRIREIRLAGFEVAHVIHRHGLDDRTAFEVEAALIDAYPSNTGIVDGHGSDARGVMHAREIVARYAAEPAVFRHRALLISVNRSATKRTLYDATRYAWKISRSKAAQAEVVLATQQGLIVGAFIAERWLDATPENFPGRDGAPGRLGFIGREAPEQLRRQYIGKRVPDEYRKRGAANPVKYTWRARPAS
jgi:hypothetical protein